MMKKIIGLTLALVMVLGMVQVPVSADATADTRNTFYVHFDTGAVGSVYDSAYLYDTTSPAQNGAIGKGNTVATIVARSDGGNALKFESNTAETTGVYIHCGDINHTMNSDDILHMGYDFMTEDKNYDRAVWLRAQDGWQCYSFLKFGKDGTFSFDGKVVCEYDVNTWYNIDIYYTHSNKKAYLFINDEYVMNKTIGYISTKFNFLRLNFGTPTADATSTVYVDNLKSEFITADRLNELLPQFYVGFNAKSANSSMFTTGYGTICGNEITGTTNTVSLNDRTTSEVTGYQKAVGDIAAKISVPTTETKRTYLAAHETLVISDGNVAHFGFEFMAGDYNVERNFNVAVTKVAGDETQSNRLEKWGLLKFKTDGTITSYSENNVIGVYELNTWYDIDIYFDCSTLKFYIFIDNELRFVTGSDNDYADKVEFRFVRFWQNVGNGYGNPTATMYVDDIMMDTITDTKFAGLIPATPTTTRLTAVKNIVDGNKNVFVKADAPEISGKIIAALYNGTELVEVKPVNASDRAYITFAKTGDNAKIMWWAGTDSDITPKVVAIPVSFATPAN